MKRKKSIWTWIGEFWLFNRLFGSYHRKSNDSSYSDSVDFREPSVGGYGDYNDSYAQEDFDDDMDDGMFDDDF